MIPIPSDPCMADFIGAVGKIVSVDPFGGVVFAIDGGPTGTVRGTCLEQIDDGSDDLASGAGQRYHPPLSERDLNKHLTHLVYRRLGDDGTVLGMSDGIIHDFSYLATLSRRQLLEAGIRAREHFEQLQRHELPPGSSSLSSFSDLLGKAGEIARTIETANFLLLTEGRLIEDDPSGMRPPSSRR